MTPRRALIVLVASLPLVACFAGYQDSLYETARRDLGCDELKTRRLTGDGVRRASADYIVEGCGQISYYRCRRVDADDVCTMLSTWELRSN